MHDALPQRLEWREGETLWQWLERTAVCFLLETVGTTWEADSLGDQQRSGTQSQIMGYAVQGTSTHSSSISHRIHMP